MKAKFLVLLFFYFFKFTIHAQQSNKTLLYFESDKSQLTEKHKKTLDSLALFFLNNSIDEISIVGHTDNIGDSIYNIGLSNKRSKSVNDYMKLKFPGINTSVSFQGENSPINFNLNAQTRMLNRRVEILWNKEPLSLRNQMKDFYKTIAPIPQEFCINNYRDTVIVGEEGTLIYIPSNSFDNSVNPSSCVQISLKERYKKSLIIRDNLTTITNDNKILVSNAMFEINSNVPLKSNKNLVVMTPTNTVIDGLKPFYGQLDGDDLMHWNQSNDRLTNVNGGLFNNFASYPCTKDSTIYDTLDTKCSLFFCKILNWTRIKRYKPDVDTLIVKKVIPCPIPAPLKAYFPDSMSLEEVKGIPKDSLEYYVFNTNRLGWRNLDWLMKIQDKTDFKVHLEPKENIEIKLIFKDYRSVIPLFPGENCYHYDGAPIGYEAWLLAFKIENEKIYLGLAEVEIDNKGIGDFNFEEVTIEELYERLKVFDK